MGKINQYILLSRLNEIEELKAGTVEKYLEQAVIGHELADYILSKAKNVKSLAEAKKQLKSSSKQLHDIRKKFDENLGQISLDIAPKHLWSIIQLIQQSNHIYTAAGATKHDADISVMVMDFIRNVPNVWEIAKTIDEVAEKRRELSNGVGRPKGDR